jgi:hypothetical protein
MSAAYNSTIPEWQDPPKIQYSSAAEAMNHFQSIYKRWFFEDMDKTNPFLLAMRNFGLKEVNDETPKILKHRLGHLILELNNAYMFILQTNDEVLMKKIAVLKLMFDKTRKMLKYAYKHLVSGVQMNLLA